MSKKATLEYQGKTQTVAEWARELGLHAPMVYNRLKRGLPAKRVLQRGHLRRGAPPLLMTFEGETLPLMRWARKVGLKRTTLRRRIAVGWSVERALTEALDADGHRRNVKAKRSASSNFVSHVGDLPA